MTFRKDGFQRENSFKISDENKHLQPTNKFLSNKFQNLP